MPFFEKYLRIMIEDHKILVLVSECSRKLNEINVSYPYKYKSVVWYVHVFHRILLIYHIIRGFFKKDVRIKIENHKILVLMSEHSKTRQTQC